MNAVTIAEAKANLERVIEQVLADAGLSLARPFKAGKKNL